MVEQRIAARDVSGLAVSSMLPTFEGTVNVDPGRVGDPGNATAGTVGFYTFAGTMVILR